MASNQTEAGFVPGWQQHFHSTLIFLACLIVLLNVPVIVLFIKISSLRYSAGNSFLCSLAIADILCAVVIIPSHYTISVASVYHIVAANIAKYFAIVFPMRNLTAFTKSRVFYTILVIWVTSFIAGHLPIYWPYLSFPDLVKMARIHNYFLLVFSFILPVLILLVTHVHMFTTLFFKSRPRTQHSRTTSTSTAGQSSLRENNCRIAILFFLLFAVFIISWLPWYLIGIGLVDPTDDYLISLRFMAPVLNPIIFTFVKRDFRGAATTLLARLCGFGPRGHFSELSRFTSSVRTEQSLIIG